MNALLAIAAWLLFLPCALRAENWPAWRGATGQGISNERRLPTRWNATNGICWRAALPDKGNSTPIVWGDRVFLTQAVAAEDRRSVMCFHRADGRLLWQSAVKFQENEPTHSTNPQNSSSPVTDGERVVAWFGSAGVYCYNLAGGLLWHRDLGKQRHIWGWGSSPVIHGDLVLLNFGPGERQFLVALNKKTGEVVWRANEPGGHSGEKHDGEDKASWIGSWSTPLIVRVEDKDQAILSLPNRVAAFDPATGKEIWTCGGLNELAYASPLHAEGVVVAMGGYNGKSVAVRVGGRGDVTSTLRLWQHPRTKQRIGSGVIYEDHIYIVDDPGIAECVELKTGKVVWEERLPGKAKTAVNWSSAMLAVGNVYVITQGGDTLVFKASPKYELVSVNSLGETSNSSLAPSGGQIFIRTHEALWCVGECRPETPR
ncbi:MAG: PQQ-binding-like beta-propeller repeat protein [Verrucomicrobia bacterium]|nr:PQQ-binding-like beta-propeller repeat protein [Verrucomicrobiota bacterium]MBI3867260.1 PQQ-binding-like beta-propeller repeat protein [Verrucomicrobiota bacterium]